MKNKLNIFIHSKIFIVILIIIFIVTAGVVGTYAWFTWSNPSGENTLFTITIGEVGEILEVNFTEGNAINGTLEPVYEYTDGLYTSFNISNKYPGRVVYEINFDITSIDSELINSQVKYVILSNNKIIFEGDLSNASAGDSLNLYSGILPSDYSSYSVYFYLDGDEENDPSMMNKVISGHIVVDAYGSNLSSSLVNFVSDLYLNNKNKVVPNGTKEYQYAEEVSLMNDRLGGTTEDYDAGNIRYYGSEPNNYVDIGDRDSSGNVVLYRIIGLFRDKQLVGEDGEPVVNEDGTPITENLIKVIRNDSIGQYSWDNKPSGVGTSKYAEGSNRWVDSRLMMLLNPGYENAATTSEFNGIYDYRGSLWWNSENGICYSTNSGNLTKECDFRSVGLSNGVQDKIQTVVWNIGGLGGTYNLYPDEYYSYERRKTHAGREVLWEGDIALLHASDYGYATDFNICNETLDNYNSSADSYACRKNDWLFTNTEQWYMTYHSGASTYVRHSMVAGNVTCNKQINKELEVRPVFYLSSGLGIAHGDGSKYKPYVLSF